MKGMGSLSVPTQVHTDILGWQFDFFYSIIKINACIIRAVDISRNAIFRFYVLEALTSHIKIKC